MISIIILLISYFAAEYFLCAYRRDKIKIRVLVNGTRGKSSVVRLINAGLRQAGIRSIAKVSGTEARLIYPDGSEKKIVRIGHANIIEQVKFIREAWACRAEAMVMEVMALVPHYQWLTEHKIFKSTIGVITNIRADHLDVMGPKLDQVAEAICGTIPQNGVLISAEQPLAGLIKEKALNLNTEVKFASGSKITDAMMQPFSYLEHRDNVACALEVCKHLGIEENLALNGMHQALPDPGVLRTFYVQAQNKKFEFINAFSANDPVSTFVIWRRVEKKFVPEQTKIVLINGRKDRLARSVQLGEFAVSDLPLDYLVLTGAGTSHMEQKAIQHGFNPAKIFNMARCIPEQIFKKVMELIPTHGVVFAAGSIGGGGMEIVDYFDWRRNG
ncbi:MAG: poly-gamma-glutamate synthase PgsB [Candidatus Omnitrophica bacterium]|nr:poly-gamma-glutamate synthase PgsB [Candidatus Omnitrophota bacterium]